MFLGLLILAGLVLFGIYYVTTMDFEIGSGFSEEKRKAKDAEYSVKQGPDENSPKLEEDTSKQ